MLAWISKYQRGDLVQALKLVLFDAERRVFAIKGELPLSPEGEPLDQPVYKDFIEHWFPRVMEGYFESKEKNITGKVKLECNSFKT